MLGDGVDDRLGERECIAAAALSEAGGDRAQPVAAGKPAPTHHPGRPGHGARRCATRAWAPSSSWWTWRPAMMPYVFIECQPAPAGRAHHHRGGDGRGPGADADCIGGRPPPAGPGPGPARCRARRAMPSSGASTPKRWMPRARPSPAAAPSRSLALPMGRACAGHARVLQAARPRRTTTRCWPAHRPTRGGSFADVLRRSQRALAECRIDGLATNLSRCSRPWPSGPRWNASSRCNALGGRGAARAARCFKTIAAGALQISAARPKIIQNQKCPPRTPDPHAARPPCPRAWCSTPWPRATWWRRAQNWPCSKP